MYEQTTRSKTPMYEQTPRSKTPNPQSKPLAPFAGADHAGVHAGPMQ